MKNLIITLTLTLCSTAFAYEVPKDAVIKVYTKDGKQIGEMNRSEYKVVKIEEDKPKHHSKEDIQMMSKAVDYEKKHNSVIIHGGVGNDGLRVRSNGNIHKVTERQRPVVGATYCYNQNKTGVCASAFSNDTYSLGIKQDF